MIKQILFLYLAFCSYLISIAQGDTRARFKPTGRTDEFSVSPAGTIWLPSAMGKLYFTDSINGYWHTHPQFASEWDVLSFTQPIFERVSFFNADTAILTGYFTDKKEGTEKNGLYRTIDGGKNWELLSFGGDSWIYDDFILPTGHAWIGGSSGVIYYSSDYGLHWQALKTDAFRSNRVASIFMLDELKGIGGALDNNIYTTDNNWKSAQQIETPLDQKLYKNKTQDYSDNRILKIRYWGNYIVVNQNGRFFYTDKKIIQWKKFPLKISEFETDLQGKYLYAFTANRELYKFSDTDKYNVLFSNIEISRIHDMKILGDDIYLMSAWDDIYKIRDSTINKAEYYTLDFPISTPEKIKKATFITWGVEGSDIYLSKDFGKTWCRDTITDFYTDDFYLKNDSVAIFWTGRLRYSYSLIDRVFREYMPEKPLSEFLQSPLQSVTIIAGTQGCFHHREDKITFTPLADNYYTFRASGYYNGDSLKSFEKQFEVSVLSALLDSVNSHPYSMPSLNDFNITEKDKHEYLALVEKCAKENTYFDVFDDEKKQFFINFLEALDTAGKYLSVTLGAGKGMMSTTYNRYVVTFTNAAGQQLQLYNSYYFSPFPWQVPITAEYKGKKFLCYNVGLQKFLFSLLPGNFHGSDAFSNPLLIYKMASLFYDDAHRDD